MFQSTSGFARRMTPPDGQEPGGLSFPSGRGYREDMPGFTGRHVGISLRRERLQTIKEILVK
jgi:hypothetical protein